MTRQLYMPAVILTAALGAFGAADRAATHRSPAKTVALHPLRVPDVISDPLPVQLLFDSLLLTELRSAGFTVVPSHESGAIWKRLVDSVQGFYDPITGELVEEEYRAVWTGTLAELRTRFNAEAWLHSHLHVVTTSFENGKAKWDGATEGVGRGGSRGTTTALTLVVTAVDAGSREIYTGRGGLQALAKYDDGFEPVRRDKLFTDRKRNQKAVALALDSLVPRLHAVAVP